MGPCLRCGSTGAESSALSCGGLAEPGMSTTSEARGHPASFRDRDGFLYERDGLLYRQVNRAYAAHYDLLMRSGLYDRLVGEGALIGHRESAQPGLVPE